MHFRSHCKKAGDITIDKPSALLRDKRFGHGEMIEQRVLSRRRRERCDKRQNQRYRDHHEQHLIKPGRFFRHAALIFRLPKSSNIKNHRGHADKDGDYRYEARIRAGKAKKEPDD